MAAVEQLTVLTLGIVMTMQGPDAPKKLAQILKFAAEDMSRDTGMRADVRAEALGAWDELASKVSEALDSLRPK